jgi:hypothetical protein
MNEMPYLMLVLANGCNGRSQDSTRDNGTFVTAGPLTLFVAGFSDAAGGVLGVHTDVVFIVQGGNCAPCIVERKNVRAGGCRSGQRNIRNRTC